jgi:hypothetical protein
MAYADDVVVMGRRLQDVNEAFASLVKQTNKQDGIRNKQGKKQDNIYLSISKALQLK